ncbi:ANTAR domain protein [Nocardioides dokdonensis FR1436]|uniref:ANTAR domain protein n=1 Tax=Nocardioides dokdonensis FR1436 TaxID=1300347 RepID=A0A1A9GEI1_9ACTN|nr:ANTAR domain-containing protein [Nocardioides dokdonensis]ANH36668.1 ANTAR domain protein [Nocardioides dokdonensis FR1436]
MSTSTRRLTPDARRSANRLLDVLQRERAADGAAGTDRSLPASCEINASPALIEQAKGALMLFYGIDSHQAFAVLVGWARMSRTPVPTVAHTFLRGVCEGNPQTAVRQRALLRWLEAQLRDGDPDHARVPSAPTRLRPAHETPRSS